MPPVAGSRVTLEQYYALKPGDLIRWAFNRDGQTVACVVVEAFDGESVLLAINRRVLDPPDVLFHFGPFAAERSERIA